MITEEITKAIEADVLVIGGGIAGSFAAIKAAEAGACVVLWEKAAVQRSGGAAGEPMHLHGVPPLPKVGATKEEAMDTLSGYIGIGFAGPPAKLDGIRDKNLFFVIYRDYWDRIHDLESWGVNLRWDDGEYNMLPDPMTGLPTEMRIRPKGMKKKMRDQLIKSGVELFERVMGIDLLTHDGTVAGATGLNIRTGEFIVCKAKATVVATPAANRTDHQYQGPALGMYKMMYDGPPDSGDGQAMAFRAGAEMVNAELPLRDRALMYEFDKFFGKIGALNQAQPRIPIVNARGEKVGETSLRLPEQLKEEEAGRTPCYLDATGVPEAVDYIEATRVDEFPMTSRIWKVRGLDWRKDKLELTEYFPYMGGKILADIEAKTSLKGLFAAGGGASNYQALAGATVFGAIAGKNAASYATGAEKPIIDESQALAQKEPVFAPMEVKDGVPPIELEMKLRDIMYRYCGVSRNEGKLNQGLWRLKSVRDKFFPEMIAKTPHELMTCQEVRNLYLLGEARLITARERKESGPGFYRKDYPELVDAPFKEAIVARLEDGEIKIGRRKMPELREEFRSK